MLLAILKRYGLVLCAAIYTGALIGLHAVGKFPAPGAYDVSRLVGSPALGFEGRVINFPQTRWGQTRFLLEGRADPLGAFHGRALVNLRFPMEDLAPGEKIRVRGWLSRLRPATAARAFDEQGYWAGYRTYSTLRVWSPEAVTRLSGHRHLTWRQRAWEFHQQFKQFCFDHLPAEEAAVLSCMTVGSRGLLSADIKKHFVRAGVYHILVVSGQNMALIIALGIGLLRLVRVPRRWAFWICCGPILFYTAVVGSDPPVVRAGAMAIAALSAISLGRDTPRYIPFVLAWLWILFREPEALFGASFQLSFGATASLLAFWPFIARLSRLRHRLLRWLAEAGAVSLAVHLGVWPLLVYYFHQLSLVGFIANWTIFPLSGGLMVAGLVVGTWGVLSPGTVPELLLAALHHALHGILFAVKNMSDWHSAVLPLPAIPAAACGVYYGLLICILWKLYDSKKSSDL